MYKIKKSNCIKDQIRDLREMRGMTRKLLGTKIGYPPNRAEATIIHCENSDEPIPEFVLENIAKALQVPAKYFRTYEAEDLSYLIGALTQFINTDVKIIKDASGYSLRFNRNDIPESVNDVFDGLCDIEDDTKAIEALNREREYQKSYNILYKGLNDLYLYQEAFQDADK